MSGVVLDAARLLKSTGCTQDPLASISCSYSSSRRTLASSWRCSDEIPCSPDSQRPTVFRLTPSKSANSPWDIRRPRRKPARTRLELVVYAGMAVPSISWPGVARKRSHAWCCSGPVALTAERNFFRFPASGLLVPASHELTDDRERPCWAATSRIVLFLAIRRSRRKLPSSRDTPSLCYFG